MTDHHPDDPYDHYLLDLTINLQLPGGWILSTIALAAITDLLGRLEHDGIRPHQATLTITETTTP